MNLNAVEESSAIQKMDKVPLPVKNVIQHSLQ